jgi:hypothetical protein
MVCRGLSFNLSWCTYVIQMSELEALIDGVGGNTHSVLGNSLCSHTQVTLG